MPQRRLWLFKNMALTEVGRCFEAGSSLAGSAMVMVISKYPGSVAGTVLHAGVRIRHATPARNELEVMTFAIAAETLSR